MAQNAGKTILTLGVVGVVAYFLYEWWTGQSTSTTSTCPANSFTDPTYGTSCPQGFSLEPNSSVLNGGCPQYECTQAAAATNATPATPAAPAYTGDTLSQMFSALQSTVAAAYGEDLALTCSPSGVSGLGVIERASMPGAGRSNVFQPTPIAIVSPGGSPNIPVGGSTQTPAASMNTVPATCSNPYATYDVFNYYLVAANVGVSTAPAPPDHTTQLSLTDYWAWAAPLLQEQIPGLSGFGHVYAGIGALARSIGRGW